MIQNIFNSLYEINNFTTYILIAIGVLVVLFFLILFLGKKDQKIEETKRLEKLRLEKAMLESKMAEPIEPITKKELIDPIKKQEDVDILIASPVKEVPKTIEQEELPKAPISPILEPVENKEIVIPEDVNVFEFTPEKEKYTAKEEIKTFEEEPIKLEIPEEKETPLIKVVEPKKPIEIFEDSVTKDKEAIKQPSEEPTEKSEIKLTEFSFDDFESTYNDEEEVKSFKPSQVFSSVFIDNEAEEKKEKVKEDKPESTIRIVEKAKEEDQLKETEPVKEEFELPKLRDDSVIEVTPKKENKGFSLDSLPVETYKSEK